MPCSGVVATFCEVPSINPARCHLALGVRSKTQHCCGQGEWGSEGSAAADTSKRGKSDAAGAGTDTKQTLEKPQQWCMPWAGDGVAGSACN